MNYFNLSLGAWLGLSMGCSASVADQYLNIEMLGINTKPAKSLNNEDPVQCEFRLIKVALKVSDTEDLLLYSGEDRPKVQIVNREQIIYSKEIKEYNAKTYQALSLEFANEFSAKARGEGEALEGVLETTTYTWPQSFKVEDGKGINLKVNVLWRGILGEQQLLPPEFELNLKAE